MSVLSTFTLPCALAGRGGADGLMLTVDVEPAPSPQSVLREHGNGRRSGEFRTGPPVTRHARAYVPGMTVERLIDATPGPRQTPRRWVARTFVIGVAVLVVAATGGVVYLAIQNQHLATEVDALEGQLKTLQTDQDELATTVTASDDVLAKTVLGLNDAVDGLRADVGTSFDFASLSDRVGDLEDQVGSSYGTNLNTRLDDVERDVRSICTTLITYDVYAFC